MILATYIETYNHIVATESDKIEAASIAVSALLRDFLTGCIDKRDYEATITKLFHEACVSSLDITVRIKPRR